MNLGKVNQIIESTIESFTKHSNKENISYDIFMWNLFNSRDIEKLSFKEFRELVHRLHNHKNIIK